MALENINFVALLFVSYAAGITGTVYDYAEHATHRLNEVAHTHRFELAVRSNSPPWYRDGMQLFAFSYSGYKWDKRQLTWAVVNESRQVPTGRVIKAAKRAFRLWSNVTPFRFKIAKSDVQQADIRISFESDVGSVLCDTRFPPLTNMFDSEGATIVINDDIAWTENPYTRDWYNIDFAILQEVSHCVGLGYTTESNSVMNKEHECFKLPREAFLSRADTRAIQVLYGFSDRHDWH